MAFSPCAFHGGKYPGGANTLFLRLVRGGDVVGGRIQVCANCTAVALEYLALHAIKVSEGEHFLEYTEPVACLNCASDLVDGHWAFYGNVYCRGMAEQQWYARYCVTCIEPITEDLHLAAARSSKP